MWHICHIVGAVIIHFCIKRRKKDKNIKKMNLEKVAQEEACSSLYKQHITDIPNQCRSLRHPSCLGLNTWSIRHLWEAQY